MSAQQHLWWLQSQQHLRQLQEHQQAQQMQAGTAAGYPQELQFDVPGRFPQQLASGWGETPASALRSFPSFPFQPQALQQHRPQGLSLGNAIMSEQLFRNGYAASAPMLPSSMPASTAGSATWQQQSLSGDGSAVFQNVGQLQEALQAIHAGSQSGDLSALDPRMVSAWMAAQGLTHDAAAHHSNRMQDSALQQQQQIKPIGQRTAEWQKYCVDVTPSAAPATAYSADTSTPPPHAPDLRRNGTSSEASHQQSPTNSNDSNLMVLADAAALMFAADGPAASGGQIVPISGSDVDAAWMLAQVSSSPIKAKKSTQKSAQKSGRSKGSPSSRDRSSSRNGRNSRRRARGGVDELAAEHEAKRGRAKMEGGMAPQHNGVGHESQQPQQEGLASAGSVGDVAGQLDGAQLLAAMTQLIRDGHQIQPSDLQSLPPQALAALQQAYANMLSEEAHRAGQQQQQQQHAFAHLPIGEQAELDMREAMMGRGAVANGTGADMMGMGMGIGMGMGMGMGANGMPMSMPMSMPVVMGNPMQQSLAGMTVAGVMGPRSTVGNTINSDSVSLARAGVGRQVPLAAAGWPLAPATPGQTDHGDRGIRSPPSGIAKRLPGEKKGNVMKPPGSGSSRAGGSSSKRSYIRQNKDRPDGIRVGHWSEAEDSMGWDLALAFGIKADVVAAGIQSRQPDQVISHFQKKLTTLHKNGEVAMQLPSTSPEVRLHEVLKPSRIAQLVEAISALVRADPEYAARRAKVFAEAQMPVRFDACAEAGSGAGKDPCDTGDAVSVAEADREPTA